MTGRRAACVVGGCLTAGAVAVARGTERGRRIEYRAEYDIGGNGAEWPAVGALLRALGPALGLALLLVAVAVLGPRWRRAAVTAGLVLVVGNVGSLAVKTAVGLVLPVTHATLPSGHATIALTLAVALLVLTPIRWGAAALAVAGFVGGGGPLAVVVAYWHSPGDALAAIALVPLWVMISAGCLRGLDAVAPSRRLLGPRPEARETVPNQGSTSIRTTLLLLASGAATAVVTLVGWGFHPVQTPLLHRAVGMAVLLGLPCLGVVVLLFAVRVLRIDLASSH